MILVAFASRPRQGRAGQGPDQTWEISNKFAEVSDDIAAVMARLGRAARQAAHQSALAAPQAKNLALLSPRKTARAAGEILAANDRDVAEATAQGATRPLSTG